MKGLQTVQLIVLQQIMRLMQRRKAQPMTKAPFGIVGSETAFPLLAHILLKWGLSQQLVDYLTIKPAQTSLTAIRTIRKKEVLLT